MLALNKTTQCDRHYKEIKMVTLKVAYSVKQLMGQGVCSVDPLFQAVHETVRMLA